jgi:hypothetical protein
MEVVAADIFILDTTDESMTGGREVEFGMALMDMEFPRRIIRVGPVRNVFHSVVRETYDSWDELLEAL